MVILLWMSILSQTCAAVLTFFSASYRGFAVIRGCEDPVSETGALERGRGPGKRTREISYLAGPRPPLPQAPHKTYPAIPSSALLKLERALVFTCESRR